jgi:hypothetical protein
MGAGASKNTYTIVGTYGQLDNGAVGVVYQGAITTSAINIGLIYAASPVGIALAGRWLLRAVRPQQAKKKPEQQCCPAHSALRISGY